jgi:cytochrome c oxidase assembly factor CtaG
VDPKLTAFLQSWSWEPSVLVGLALAAGLYALGWRRLRRKCGRGAGPAPWRAWCYGGGLATIALALLSPIAVYGSLFFFMHMIQHLLLLMLAAPLLWLGAPLVPVLWGLPRGLRRELGRVFVPGHPLQRVGHALTHPPVAAVLYVGTIAFWHVPAFYDAAQGRTAIHDLEHAMFLGTALLYWWPIVHPSGGRRRLGYGLAIPYLLPPFLEGILIGAPLTFAGRPVYDTYRRVPRVWDLSVVGDQQLGGLIMWVPGGMMYLVPLVALLVLLLNQEERSAAPPGRAAGAQGRVGSGAGGREREAHRRAPDSLAPARPNRPGGGHAP